LIANEETKDYENFLQHTQKEEEEKIRIQK